ncbi:MAG: 30S ribosomal protein S4 [Coxiellaceae bacterium]|jgi:small subunit ribosomal protein S4|nr:30S ribosomal protein S4 [Coxiellaceae bacterium]
MAKYIGPKCRLSRRAGVDLQHKSKIRSLDSKCKASVPPGQFGERASRATDYNLQLRMKQLIKFYYGILERQFHNYYKKADRQKGSSGENLIRMLESRLDNVVYRMGFAATRAESRQMVNHRSVMVNSKIVNIPSYAVSPNDEIAIKEKSKKQGRIANAIIVAEKGTIPEWLTVDSKKTTGIFKRYPDASEFPPEFKVHLVIELYSK